MRGNLHLVIVLAGLCAGCVYDGSGGYPRLIRLTGMPLGMSHPANTMGTLQVIRPPFMHRNPINRHLPSGWVSGFSVVEDMASMRGSRIGASIMIAANARGGSSKGKATTAGSINRRLL